MSKISELSDGGVIQGGDTLIAVRSGGNVKVTYGGTTTANIDGGTIDGTTIGGTTPAAGSFTTGSFTGDVSFGDNDKAIFGAGSDLEIFHDGSSTSFIQSSTSNIEVKVNGGGNFKVGDEFGNHLFIVNDNGDVQLKHGSTPALKLATTATGIDVTGTVTADGVSSDGNISMSGAGTGSRYVLLGNETSAYAGSLVMQAGGGSAAYGGSIIAYGHSHASKAGDIVAGISSGSGGSFRVNTSGIDSGGDVLVVEASGNVGIGTSSPSSVLHLSTSNDPQITLTDTGFGASADITGSNGNLRLNSQTATIFDMADSEVMRIDSSGNLLVGTTDAVVWDNSANSAADNGHNLRDDGRAGFAYYNATAGANATVNVNRTGSDGDLIRLFKSGTTVGSIGVLSSRFYIGSGDTGLKFSGADDLISPIDASDGTGRDAAIDLGSSGARFDDIYATNGTIQTSDRNEKQDIEALSDAEQRVAVACKGLLRKFRWINSVETKGDDARIHFGIIAQDLQTAFEAEGLDAGRYAMFINSTWTDEETGEERTRLGVRYSELLAFIIAAI